MTTTRDYPFGPADALELDAAYAHLRREEPLTRVRLPYGGEGWLVTRQDDVRTVLADPRFSREAVLGIDVPRTRPEKTDQPGSILTMDPPDHGRLRRLVAAAFTARRIEALRPRTRELTHRLLDDMAAAGPGADLTAHLSTPLPVTVICELLGVPLDGRPIFRAGADAALSTGSMTPEERTSARDALFAYMASLIEERRRSGDESDLLGAMVAVRDADGDRLSEPELIMLGAGILIAGHETTMNQIGNMVWLLLQETQHRGARPDGKGERRWEWLRADPARVPAAVEELLRYVPLGVSAEFPRVATEDVELTGGTVRAGDPVLVGIAAANRDPEVFDDPERLVLDRDENRHVGFGFGPHHCLGAALARMELQEALTALGARFEGLALGGDPQWRTGALVRGLDHLPLTWTRHHPHRETTA